MMMMMMMMMLRELYVLYYDDNDVTWFITGACINPTASIIGGDDLKMLVRAFSLLLFPSLSPVFFSHP